MREGIDGSLDKRPGGQSSRSSRAAPARLQQQQTPPQRPKTMALDIRIASRYRLGRKIGNVGMLGHMGDVFCGHAWPTELTVLSMCCLLWMRACSCRWRLVWRHLPR